MTLRTPYDGMPFYCANCGAGFYEMMACERADCEREDVRDAERRRDKIKQKGTDLSTLHNNIADASERSDVRVVLCDACGSEGRVLRSNGGPYDIDCGECPECRGVGSVIIETQSIEISDLDAVVDVSLRDAMRAE